MAQDFDLDLASLWFTKLPPAFPVPSMRLKGPFTSTYAYSWEEDFTSTKKILVCSIRWISDFSTTKVRISWTASSPLRTATTQQKHFPSPPPLSPEALLRCHQLYGSNVATWAESSLDTTVGDGECWTLIHTALTDLAPSYRQHGQEPPLPSQGRTHGYPILSLCADSPGSLSGMLQLADVRRGDILQKTAAHFKIVTKEEEEVVPPSPEGEFGGRWRKGPGVKNVRMAHHTAVVAGVQGDILTVVEQNGSVPRAVGRGTYCLGEMQSGEMVIFRVVGERWIKPLDACWE